MACAKLVCNGNLHEAAEYAAKRWNDSTPEVALTLKAAVAPGTTTDATWAVPLVNATSPMNSSSCSGRRRFSARFPASAACRST